MSLMLLTSLLLMLLTQQPSTVPIPPRPAPQRPTTSPDDNPNAPINTPAKILKYQHEETMKDIDKLVKLIGEVHKEVEDAGENVLPLNTLKKLEDVERLSRKIRGRLKQ